MFLYCSPTKPRGNDLAKWQDIIAKKSQNAYFDNEFLDKFEVSSDDEKFILKSPKNLPQDNPFAFEPCELTPDTFIQIGNGTLKFIGLGVAYCEANHISGQDVPYKFFDKNLQPENAENIKSLWQYEMSEKDSYFRYNPWPTIKIGFEHEGIEDIMFHGLQVFDARTHKSISTGAGSHGTRTKEHSIQKFTADVPFWHQAPVDIVFDISFGPSKVHEFQPKANEGFKENGFECRLIEVLDDINPNRYSHKSSYNNMEIYEFPRSSPDNKGLRFLFACQPTADKMPVTFTFLDKDENKIQYLGSSTIIHIHDITFGQPLEKVAKIRAKYRTNRYRIIMHLPYIPGLPEQNSDIDNLFDVHIPYAKLYDTSQANRFLYETLQLDHLVSEGQKPSQKTQTNSFPIVFTDVKIRDIAKIYTTGGRVNPNIENDTLEINYPLPLLTRLKMLFYNIRNNDNE